MTRGKNLIQGELRPELFNELLNGPLSTRIAYARAEVCPCAGGRDINSPDPRCAVCGGLGYTWSSVTPDSERAHELTRAPAPGYEFREKLPDARVEIISIVDEHGVSYDPALVSVMPDGKVRWADGEGPADYTLYTVTTSSSSLRAGVQSVMSRREYQVRGEYDVLDLQMTLDRHLGDGKTPNPAWDCGEFDRFSLLDGYRRHVQKVQRGQSGPAGDLLLYRSMRDLVLTSLEGGVKRVWVPGEDYTFTDGRVVWAEGRGPKREGVYAAHGQASPEYYVYKALPQIRQQNAQELPRVIILKGFEGFPNRRPGQPV